MRRLCVRRNSPKPHGQHSQRYGRLVGGPHACRGKAPAETASHDASFWALTLGSVGVVYGDIGTSPLYAFREAVVAAQAGGPVTREIVLGVLSLIVWSLIIVVTLKYIVLLLRMDNNGEGGTLSLTALAFRAVGRRAPLVLMLGVIGAAMFYGSSLITPALSVLSAVEGLKIVDAGVRTLRAADHDRAPGRAVRGAVARNGQGRGAVRPDHGRSGSSSSRSPARCTSPTIPACLPPSIRTMRSRFVAGNGMIGLITLGAVFLVVTGSEALYADLGHFGRKPIQTAWFYLVLPALLINYFGQGALVLANPEAIDESVLSARARCDAAADGRAGDGRRPSSRARR